MLDTFAASDGYRWYYRRFLPVERAWAHVIFLHGIQSHGGWYLGTCEYLRAAGVAVSFLDRRGSGLNTSHRGDAPSFRRLIDDVAEYAFHCRTGRSAIAGMVPIVVAAISWGGKLAVGLTYRHPGLLDGVALLCPGICPKVRPSFGQQVMIARYGLFRPWKHVPIPLSDPELFTDNPDALAFLRRDPLALHQATARFMVQSRLLDIYLGRAWRGVHCPALLMLAGRDRIIDNARTRRYFERFPGERHIVEYPDAHHTLEFERDPEPFRADLLAWLRGIRRA